MKKKQTILIISIIIVIMIILSMICVKLLMQKTSPLTDGKADENISFDYKIIKEANINNENYLISPLSIGYALKMLNEGAKNGTKIEIENVLDNYTIPSIDNIENRIGIANALFIKDLYKDYINEEFTSKITTDYNAEILYDKFVNPDILNTWVKNKTYNMIPKTVEELSEEFVMGIVNTIAIDAEWKNEFKCNNTNKRDFTKEDGTIVESVMMNTDSVTSYFENKNAKGIVKDFKPYGNTNLEYIAIMPNGNLEDYINNFNNNTLNSLLKTTSKYSNKKVYLSIPRYTYDYNFDKLKDSLKDLGINKVFDQSESNLKNIIDSNEINLYLSQAIHKTHIEFSEKGTKAAAVTAMIIYESSGIETEKPINIEFNKPFMYIIKDKNTDNIWFFGTVYEPELWTKDTITCAK